MIKVITKNMHQRLDKFTSNYKQEELISNNSSTNIEDNQTSNYNKKTIKKKSDGLIEKLDTKIYIAEDNRQLLND